MSIENHNFEDADIDHACIVDGHFDDKGFVEINFSGGNSLQLFERDVDALAKHFNSKEVL